MDPLSIAASVASLVTICAQIVSICSEISTKYQDAPRILSSIKVECATTQESLRLIFLLINRSDTTALSQLSTNEILIQNFDIALTGCTLTLSVIDKKLQSILKEHEFGGGLSTSRKTKFAWKEDALKEVMDELRGQRDALNLLVSVVQSHSLSETLGILRANDDVFKGVKRRTDTLCSLQKSGDLSVVSQLSMSDTYSIFSEATERDFFDFDNEILQSPAYRKVYSSVRASKHLRHTKRKPSAMVANLLDDDDLIQLVDHPPLAASYSEELQKEMLADQAGENLPEDSATGERNSSTYKDSETAVLEVSDGRRKRTPQSSRECSSEDVHAMTGNHSPAPSLRDVHGRTTARLSSDRTQKVRVQTPVIESDQLVLRHVPRLAQERGRDANTSEISFQLDKATAPPEDAVPESKNPSLTSQTLDPIHPELNATDLSDDPLVAASALGHHDSVCSILLQVKVIDSFAINVAFFYAACNGYTKVMEMLLLRSADVNCQLSGTVKLCGGLHVNLSSLHFAAANNQGSITEFLLDHGADINIKNSSSWTPLHAAAARGSTSAVEVLLRRGAVLEARACLTGGEVTLMKAQLGKENIDKQTARSTQDDDAYNVHDCTPLYLAAVFSFFETVRVLLANGANKDVKVEFGMTLLHAVSGEFGFYTRKFRDAASSLKDLTGYTTNDESSFPPPQISFESESSSPALLAPDRVQLLEFLVQIGCDAQHSDDFGFTPLHLACLQDNLDVLQTLLKITINVSAISNTGWTPLHLAALLGHVTKAKAILDAGGELVYDQSFYKALAPIEIAILLRHHTMTRFLLQRGASIEWQALADWKVSLLSFAAVNSCTSGLVLLAKQGICWQRKLTNLDVHVTPEMTDEDWLPLGLRIDINARDSFDRTTLLQNLASLQPVLTVVQLMLDLKADVKARDDRGRSVLHSSKLDPEVATVLIEAGADVEARDKSGRTPLLEAVVAGYPECLRFLINHGADIYAKDYYGKSAWKLYNRYHGPDLVEKAAIHIFGISRVSTDNGRREIKEILDDAKKTRPLPTG